jgi:hypothetical protein
METMSYLVTNIPLSPFFIIAASSFYYTSKPNHLVLFLQAPVMVVFTLGVLEVERRYGKIWHDSLCFYLPCVLGLVKVKFD